jgi:hypothetical protein
MDNKAGGQNRLAAIGSVTRSIDGRGRTIQSVRRDIDAKPEANPLDELTPTGDIEADDAAEIATVASRIGQKTKEVSEVMGNDYWLNLVFVSPAQKKEFLTKMGWHDIANEFGVYYDGIEAAKRLGVDLTPTPLPFRGQMSNDKLVNAAGLIEQPNKRK